MAEQFRLRDDGTLDYDESFLTPEAADALFAELRAATPWEQEAGRGRPFPRLTAWYADPGLTYSYSGVTHRALAWTPALGDIRRRVENADGLAPALEAAFQEGGVQLVIVPVDYSENARVLVDELHRHSSGD